MKPNLLLVLLMISAGLTSCSKEIEDSVDKKPETRAELRLIEADNLTEEQAINLTYGVTNCLSPTYAEWYLGFRITTAYKYTKAYQVNMANGDESDIIYYRGIFLFLPNYCKSGGCQCLIYATIPEQTFDIRSSTLPGDLVPTGRGEVIYETINNVLTPVGKRYEYACECEYDHQIIRGLWICVEARSIKRFEQIYWPSI